MNKLWSPKIPSRLRLFTFRPFCSSTLPRNPLAVMKERGMLNFVSNEDLVSKRSLIGEKRPAAYIGFDPTAKALHIGNLLSLLSLLHFQRAGFKPIIVLGGATGMIGDPSGRSTERQLLQKQTVEENIQSLFDAFKTGDSCLLSNLYKEPHTKEYFASAGFDSIEKLIDDVIFINNYDIYKNMTIIDFIRDIGIHFRMSSLLSRQSVQKRLESTEGMTFTEFSYQLLQGYDFSYLHNKYNCIFQLGGSDQWGNIASGIEYIRKTTSQETFGATVNLLTDSKGEKLGKSTGNALSIIKNGEYDFYQFLLNVQDDSLDSLFKYLTFMPLDKIKAIMEEHKHKAFDIIPGTDGKVQDERYAHKILAKTITEMVYGKECLRAIEASNAFFDHSINDIFGWSPDRISEHFKNVDKIRYNVTQDTTISSLIIDTQLAKSKTETKRLISQDAIMMNSQKVSSDRKIQNTDILQSSDPSDEAGLILIKVGKKKFVLVKVASN